MLINILQTLEIITLAILFSLLFYSTNNRKAKMKKTRLNETE